MADEKRRLRLVGSTTGEPGDNDDRDLTGAADPPKPKDDNIACLPLDPSTLFGQRQILKAIEILMEAHIEEEAERQAAVARQTEATNVLIDVVDEHDLVTGQEKLSVIYRDRMTNYRVINVILENSRSQILVLKRGPNRIFFPDCLDASLSSHVLSGETYEEALAREMLRELDLHLNHLHYDVLGLLTPIEHEVSAFLKVYHIRLDITPEHKQDDFSEANWLTRDDLLARLETAHPANVNLVKLLRMYNG